MARRSSSSSTCAKTASGHDARRWWTTRSARVRTRTACSGSRGRAEGMAQGRTMSHCGAWVGDDSAQAGNRRRRATKVRREREVEDKSILVILKIYWVKKKMMRMTYRGKKL
jgi:hypothetical protein